MAAGVPEDIWILVSEYVGSRNLVLVNRSVYQLLTHRVQVCVRVTPGRVHHGIYDCLLKHHGASLENCKVVYQAPRNASNGLLNCLRRLSQLHALDVVIQDAGICIHEHDATQKWLAW